MRVFKGSKSVMGLAGCLVFAAVPLLAQAPPRAEIAVMEAVGHALSAPLRDFVPFSHELPAPAERAFTLRKPGVSRPGNGGGGSSFTDPVLETTFATSAAAVPGSNFDGVGVNGSIPPDANLAVGATQVVEIVNTEFAVYDKFGNTVQAAAPIHIIFASLGGLCASTDGGDPIVLYDQLAGRWLISQLAYNGNFTTNLICIAVSKTSDATGAYNLYAYSFGSSLPDYPKFGVWPDGYYFSANMFQRATTFSGAKACAFDRNAMIAGTNAVGVCFQGSTSLSNILPSNLDGATVPPAGSRNYYLQFVSNALNLYRFHVDYVTPANSTFTGTSVSGVAAFQQACAGGACVPQPGLNTKLDSLGDRLMYRLSYRNFGTYESLLVNHSVQVSSASNQTGIRWYEIRNPNGTPTVAQQSTFAPGTSIYRWMGSIAQDKQGNTFVGYSTSSSSIFPGASYTGRLAGDPLGQMQAESLILNGAGSQTTYSRWGDYTSVAVDPVDDCTFWYVGEYLPSTGVFNWNTRVASFKFSGCQ